MKLCESPMWALIPLLWLLKRNLNLVLVDPTYWKRHTIQEGKYTILLELQFSSLLMECVLPVVFDVTVLPVWSCLPTWHRLPPAPCCRSFPQASISFSYANLSSLTDPLSDDLKCLMRFMLNMWLPHHMIYNEPWCHIPLISGNSRQKIISMIFIPKEISRNVQKCKF